MVVLGTHPTLSEGALNKLVGITGEERGTKYRHIQLLNHHWIDPESLSSIGVIKENKIKSIAGTSWHESLPIQVDIRINKAIFDYDHLIILRPTFPHEVAGFSGGAKYLFPGKSGPKISMPPTGWVRWQKLLEQSGSKTNPSAR